MSSSARSNAAGLRLERIHASKQFRDGRFWNTEAVMGPGLRKGTTFGTLKEFVLGEDRKRRDPDGALPLVDPRETWKKGAETGLRVTWLGHSTMLLELDGARVLTDPVFGLRASPLRFAGPRRFHPVPVPLEQLPPLDAVLLSHDHYDHLCAETIRALSRMGTRIVTSLGVGKHLEALGVEPANITELDWWESFTLPGRDLQFTATPAQHFSGRGALDRNATLWSSWVLQSSRRRVFFSGDTGLTTEFRDIHAKFGSFDLVMLEIGAWNEAWGDIHLGPKNALQAFEYLGGGTLLPVHWGTFNLALHAWDEPAETLVKLASAAGQRLVTPRLGMAFEPERVERIDPWWREVEHAHPSTHAELSARTQASPAGTERSL